MDEQLGFCCSCTLYPQRLPASNTVTLTEPDAPLKMPVPPTMALVKVAFWGQTCAQARAVYCATAVDSSHGLLLLAGRSGHGRSAVS